MINAVASYVAWWACLLGAANGLPWAGPIVVAVFGAVVLAGSDSPARRRGRAGLLVAAAALGYAADSSLVLSGVLSFPERASLGAPSTLWMVALWVNLALTLDSSMAWLRGRYLLAAFGGAVSGPLAYVAGERLGAATLGPSPAAAVLTVAVMWLLALPGLVLAAERTVFRVAPGPAPMAGTDAGVPGTDELTSRSPITGKRRFRNKPSGS